MARLTEADKARNEAAIRAAMDRVLVGNLPPGGKVDPKTLATTADVSRTGFYPKKSRDATPRPGTYQHLAEEFEQRLQELRAAGEIVDPRDARVDRLKKQVDELKERVAIRDEQPAELTESKALEISQPAAQYDEIKRLRTQVAEHSPVRSVPNARDHP
ncbi:hypothetical protein ACF1BP_34740 [Streptomyces sp. NPDC014735]|uniref:hypothetical protein n=1 Tax=unclassified Streptomyces TaxID=2593676 RepID=UPI0036FEF23F